MRFLARANVAIVRRMHHRMPDPTWAFVVARISLALVGLMASECFWSSSNLFCCHWCLMISWTTMANVMIVYGGSLGGSC